MKRGRDAEGSPAEQEAPSSAPDAAASTSSAPAASSASSAATAAQLRNMRLALAALPSGEMYERSYMHRDHVTHVVTTPTDFVVTASRDGQIKFWKKMQRGIEFVKHFRAHLAPIACVACSRDGTMLATTAPDKAFKIFDVLSFDMIRWVKLDFIPGPCEWVSSRSGAGSSVLAVGDVDSGAIRLFAANDDHSTPFKTLTMHSAPVLHIRSNHTMGSVISADARGVIEYWESGGDYGTPKDLQFRFKMDTDLYNLAKAKALPTSLSVSPNGEFFAVTSTDSKVRVYRYLTGKTRRTYDESYDALNQLQKEGDDAYRLEAFDFGRRMAVEREYRAAGASAPPSNVCFDRTSSLIIFPSLTGVKVIDIKTSKLVRLYGKVENTERFVGLALFQGRAELDLAMLGSGAKISSEEDPTLFCCAFKRSRFYMFTLREPEEPDGDDQMGRDVFNEKPSKEDLALAAREAKGPLPRMATLNTSYGEIRIKLFPDECPRTVENFATHAANGYYDGVIFHRVIKGFMIQTGDPLGDGTGGTSIWGHEFEDEFHRSLRHDRPFTVSMANAGPGTNGSQFFITTAPTTWLDNKHTVFGRVVQGMDAVQAIEKVKVTKADKPIMDIKILSIMCTHD
ncbi:hypothetical protein AB1Y20_021640 [Prymnesium parvum]|uniref:peptidylprolyl isomerase n=1 Tax=Prymnesium parvum TaxID=97485 RepID=A0AB34JM40_PRYPA